MLLYCVKKFHYRFVRFIFRSNYQITKNLSYSHRILPSASFLSVSSVNPFINNNRKVMELASVVKVLEEMFPPQLAEGWDNTGLLIEPPNAPLISLILFTNDLTEEVVEEAITLKANMIVAYHPPIFSPMKRLTSKSWKERVAMACIAKGIAVYSPHTACDAAAGGVNDWLIDCFNCEDITAIKKVQDQNEFQQPIGMGRSGTLKKPMKLTDCIQTIKTYLKLNHIRFSLAVNATLDTKISTVAVCAGSGSGVLKGVAADLWLTGEMSHHDLIDAAHCGSTVVLAEHSNSERGFLPYLTVRIEAGDLMPGVRTAISEADRDPVTIV